VTRALLAPLATALDGTGRLVGAVTGEEWELPTPCTDRTVRQLINHVVGGNRLSTRVLGGAPLPPLDRLGRGGPEDQLEKDPVAAYRSSSDELLEALRAPGVLERTHPSRGWSRVPAGRTRRR
jgi:uncharacterized protein (TIGR03086 family)